MHFLTHGLLAAAETAINGTQSTNNSWISDLIRTAPGLAWVILALIALIVFRSELELLLGEIAWRIKAGAAFKLASIELGAPYVSHQQQERVAGIQVQEGQDLEREFAEQRKPFKAEFRNLFLVHRLAPSRDKSMLYDVEIYLIPSLHYGSLKGVQSVDYYFGKYWDSKVFTSNTRENGFAISTSAWAPFSCTARVNFTDGEHAFLHRLADFEMGPLGNVPYRKDVSGLNADSSSESKSDAQSIL